MLVIAGETDPRSTLGSTMSYAHALEVRGIEVELRVYGGGDNANAMEEQVEQSG